MCTEFWKKAPFFPKEVIIFHSELILSWLYPSTTKITSRRSTKFWVWLSMSRQTQPKVVDSKATIPW